MKHKRDASNYLSAQGYSAEDIATRLRPAKPINPVSIPSRGKKFFSFSKSPYRLWGYPSYHPVATGGFFAEGKEAGARS
jgi:hypothetical protein